MTLGEFAYHVLLKPKVLRTVVRGFAAMVLPASVRLGGVRVAVNRQDLVIGVLLALRRYERAELAFVASQIRPGMTAVDVGANVGLFTAVLAEAVGASGTVVALEPDPENFGYLQQTIALNQFRNVRAVQAAAGEAAGSLTLHTNSGNRGDHRLYRTALADGEVPVEVLPVDVVLERAGIATVEFVKIDVQGYEAKALAGMARTLRQSPGVVVLMEFWPHGLRCAGSDPLQLLNGLREMGFGVSLLGPGGALHGVADDDELIDSLPGDRYANLVLRRG
jgi:FkbM family methyltransferase